MVNYSIIHTFNSIIAHRVISLLSYTGKSWTGCLCPHLRCLNFFLFKKRARIKDQQNLIRIRNKREAERTEVETEYTETSKTMKKKEKLFSIFYRDVWKIQVEQKIKHSADKGRGMIWQKPQEIQLKQMPRPAAQAPVGKKNSSTEKDWGSWLKICCTSACSASL